MYREIIELKKDISNETLSKIKDICISAHYNRAGKVDIMEFSEHCFVFQGEEVDYGCLILGYLELDDIKNDLIKELKNINTFPQHKKRTLISSYRDN